MARQRVTYVLGHAARELSIDVAELGAVDPDDPDAVERAIKDRIVDDVRRNVILEDLVPGDAADVIEHFAEAIRDDRAARASAQTTERDREARAALERRRASGGGRRKR